jgi:hypothetical protein
MNATTLDLASAPVLLRAANVIVTHGLMKEEFTGDNGARCSAGAISDACYLDPADWYDNPDLAVARDEDDLDELESWQTARAAALAALRTLIGHLYPDSRPEEMSRIQLLDKVATWNDDEHRTAGQVAAAMRAAAREAVATP